MRASKSKPLRALVSASLAIYNTDRQDTDKFCVILYYLLKRSILITLLAQSHKIDQTGLENRMHQFEFLQNCMRADHSKKLGFGEEFVEPARQKGPFHLQIERTGRPV